MAKQSYSLLEDFELKGLWWLPDHPDHKVPGTLSFENEKRISLELLGGFQNKVTYLSGSFQPDIILGITVSGEYCTLLGNREAKNQINSPGIDYSTFSSSYLFIGKHYCSVHDIVFSSFQVSFTNLENWLFLKDPFPIEKPENKLKGEWKLTYSNPEVFSAKIDALNSTVESIHELNQDIRYFKQVTWNSRAYLKITPKKNRDFEWFRRVFLDLCCFLTLVISDTTYVISIKAFGDDIEITREHKSKETIEVFFTQNKPSLKQDIHHFEMLIPFHRISSKIETVLCLWFSRALELRSVYNLFFGTFYNPGMFLEFHFLSLIQATESYHRATKEGKYLSDKDWKPYRDALIETIPTALDNSHKESLKSRLKYGNEYSLRKRLIELMSVIDEKSLTAMFPSKDYVVDKDVKEAVKIFINKIIDTRNYLTHYDSELKDSSLKEVDLYWAYQRLRLFLTLLLLKEVDIDEETIIASMKENNKISQILSHRLSFE